MSSLRSALDEFVTEDLRGQPDARLEEDFDDLQRAAETLEAERLRRLAELDRRKCFARDGHLSMTSWLAHRYRMAHVAANQMVRVARALEDMPVTRRALEAGEVSPSAVQLLASARRSDPVAYQESEAMLVDAARTLSIRQLGRAVAYWRQAADSGRAMLGDDRLDRRRLHVSSTVFGMVRLDGDLDPETGQTLITALCAVQDADSRMPNDDRTPAQRRADALGEICRQWLGRSDRPRVAGELPHVVVTMDLAGLQGRPGGRSEFDDVGPVHPEAARRWACDASIIRVVTRGRSEPLDVGRRTPVVPAGMRRALVVRDEHCRFPGCDRPQAWCDAHHVRHWADGGSTALSNLVLLCRPHHRAVHGDFRVDMRDGEPIFRRRDGSVLEDRAPP